jgi:hypothetical protein
MIGAKNMTLKFTSKAACETCGEVGIELCYL